MRLVKIVKEIFVSSKGLSTILFLNEILLGFNVFFRIYTLHKLLNNVMDMKSMMDSRIILSITLFFISICSASVLMRLKEYIFVHFTNELSEQFTATFLQKIASISYATFQTGALYDRIKRFYPPEQTAANTFMTLISVVQHLVSLVSVSYFFIALSPLLFACVILLFFVSLVFNLKELIGLRTVRIKQSTAERKAQYISQLFTDRRSLKEIGIYGAGKYLLKLWRDEENRLIEERNSVRKKGFLGGIVSQLCSVTFISLSVCMMCWFTAYGKADVPLFISLITALPSFALLASWYIPNDLYEYSTYSVLWEDYFHIMLLEGDELNIASRDSSIFAGDVQNLERIEFIDVDFAYPNSNRLILQSLSVCIKAKENTAIVGVNGSGKTTMIKLLLRLYEPTRGKILINGRDIRTYSRTVLRKYFSPIFQDFMIYSETISYNIRISGHERSATQREIIAAAEKGGATAFIESLPYKFEQQVGKFHEHAVELSGGEEQLLAMSRAYYAQSDMLILDEPTASLDPMAESAQYERFIRAMKQKGSIIISHRLASARMADRILVLHDGRIHQDGTHDTLIGDEGLYARMYTAQSSLYKGREWGGWEKA